MARAAAALQPLCGPDLPHAGGRRPRPCTASRFPSCLLPVLPWSALPPLQDYEVKMARGDGMGMKQRKQEYFKTVQKQ